MKFKSFFFIGISIKFRVRMILEKIIWKKIEKKMIFLQHDFF